MRSDPSASSRSSRDYRISNVKLILNNRGFAIAVGVNQGLLTSEYVWFAVSTVLRFSRLYMSKLTDVLVPDHRNTLPTLKSSWCSRSRYSVSGLMMTTVVFCVGCV